MSCVIGVVVSSMRARTRSPVWVLPMILNWLDDHSRFLISFTAHRPVTGDDVVTTFLTAIDKHATPASTLTDNGLVYGTWQSDFTHWRLADAVLGRGLRDRELVGNDPGDHDMILRHDSGCRLCRDS